MANNYPDALLGALFTLAAAASLGIAEISLLDFALSDVLVTLEGVEVSYATAISLATLSGAWALNSPDWNRFSNEQQGLVAATVLAVLLCTVSPEFTDFLSSSVFIALSAVGIEAGGYWAVAQSS